MKNRYFAFALSVFMALATAASAMAAYCWSAGPGHEAESFAGRYKIEVVKQVLKDGVLIEDSSATAAKDASVFFYIRLTVSGAASAPGDDTEPDQRDAVQKNARADITITGLENPYTGEEMVSHSGVDLSMLANGVYYFNAAAPALAEGDMVFKDAGGLMNSDYSPESVECYVINLNQAHVHAAVYAQRPLDVEFEKDGYFIRVNSSGEVVFASKQGGTAEDYVPTAGDNIVKFARNGNEPVYDAVVVSAAPEGNFVDDLYTYLGFDAADMQNGSIYMTDENLRAAFGFNYRDESSITWKAKSAPPISTPTRLSRPPRPPRPTRPSRLP